MGKEILTKGKGMYKSKRCANSNFLGNGGYRERASDSSVEMRRVKTSNRGGWSGRGR